METQIIITRFIREQLLRGDSVAVPGPDESLISTGILDSVAVLKLLLFIEEHFSLLIGDGEVTPTNFETVNQITAFIESKSPKTKGPNSAS